MFVHNFLTLVFLEIVVNFNIICPQKGLYMQLNVVVLEDGIKYITLIVRMDIIGSQEIDTKLTSHIASESANVIIDMAGVDFIASIGIGVIAGSANALLKRHGKIVILNPQPAVFNAIKMTRITEVIPIVFDMDTARSYLKAIPTNYNLVRLIPDPREV
jgi:anti-anti-sigma factor